MPPLPCGWRLATLRGACHFRTKPRGLRYEDYPLIPFVPMELIPTDGMYFHAYEERTRADVRSGTYFEAGDVLVPKITPCFENGKQGIIPALPNGFGVATTEVVPLRGLDGVSDTEFLFLLLMRSVVRAELADKMQGTTGRQRLPKEALADLAVLLPPLAEQRAIARALKAVQAARDARRR